MIVLKRIIAFVLTMLVGLTMLTSCGGNKFKDNIDDVVVTGQYTETDYTVNGEIKYVKPKNENFVYEIKEYEEIEDFKNMTLEKFMTQFAPYMGGVSDELNVDVFKSIDFKGKEAFYLRAKPTSGKRFSNILLIKTSKKKYYMIYASTTQDNMATINEIYGSIEFVS